MAVRPDVPGAAAGGHEASGIGEAVRGLAAQVEGEVVVPGAPGYDESRLVWNGMIDRRPAAVLYAGSAADVVAGVDLARRQGMLLAIRSGGHNIAGNAVCDGGLVIDTSRMRSIEVDAERRRARVEAGCLLADLDGATQAHGLATPGGIISSTGVAGLTLGGGFGWLSRRLGLSVDNLLSAEVVTASGEVLRASTEEHPDLFWGLRGGGGNFGVVTSFEFVLHAVGPEVYAGLVAHPFSEAKRYLQRYRDVASEAPDELSAWQVLRLAPPLPFLPEDVHGEPVVITAFVYLGNEVDGERVVRPLREFGTVLGEHLGMMPFAGWQQGFDALNQPGARNYWKSHNLTGLSDGVIDALLHAVATFPSPHCEIFLPHLGGAVARVPVDATAYAHRDVEFLFNVHTRWTDPADDELCIAWARDLFDRTRPFAKGVYVNFLSEEGADRIRDAYPEATYERLRALKKKYDPENLFRMNHNVAPD